EIRVLTERREISLGLSEMDQGSWVMFELPGFTSADSGAELGSIDALRAANATSYFKGDDALWVKLVVTEPLIMPIRPSNMQAVLRVSR
ncbi:MAG TPA: hypothetical protein VGE69_11930, partial [Pseudomonadales bacterium]